MSSPGHNSAPTGRVLDQPMFLGQVEEEISRCLRTRRHLSVALLIVKGAAGPNSATIAEDLARHIRRYDHVTVSGAAEVMFLFAEATHEHAEAILVRLRSIGPAVPVSKSGGAASSVGPRDVACGWCRPCRTAASRSKARARRMITSTPSATVKV